MNLVETLVALVVAIIAVGIVMISVSGYVRSYSSFGNYEEKVVCEQNLTSVMLALLNGSTPSVLERNLSDFNLSIEESSVNGIGVYRVSMECGGRSLEGTVIRW